MSKESAVLGGAHGERKDVGDESTAAHSANRRSSYFESFDRKVVILEMNRTTEAMREESEPKLKDLRDAHLSWSCSASLSLTWVHLKLHQEPELE